MKQKYYVVLNAQKHRLMIESLNQLRNKLIADGKYRHKYLYSSAFPKRKNRLISSGFYFSLHVFKQSFCFIQQESAVLFTALLKLKLSIIC